MKLYSTITSERASKSQGGNKFIENVITINEEQGVIVNVRYDNPESKLPELNIIIDRTRFEKVNILHETKGKRQKSEHVCSTFVHGKCATCGADN